MTNLDEATMIYSHEKFCKVSPMRKDILELAHSNVGHQEELVQLYDDPVGTEKENTRRGFLQDQI